MNPVSAASTNGFISHDSLFLLAGSTGSDSIRRWDATYAVRFSPLQCQENKNAF
jgi:hypothetical protein